MKFGGNAGASVDAYLEYKRYILVGPFGPSSIRPTTTILIRRPAPLFTCNPCKESLSDTEMVPLHKWGSKFIPVVVALFYSVLGCIWYQGTTTYMDCKFPHQAEDERRRRRGKVTLCSRWTRSATRHSSWTTSLPLPHQ